MDMKYQKESGDVWDANCPKKGDCEDFSLCKAKKLMEAGYDPSRIAIVTLNDTKTKSGHAVLMVDEKVYDNRNGNDGRAFDEISHYQPLMACYLDGKIGFFAGKSPLKTEKDLEKAPKCAEAFKQMKG